LRASRHLKTIGAYQAVIDLIARCSLPIGAWPNTATALEVRTIVGWAEMRAGRTDAGQATLKAVIDDARTLDDGDLFAEAVRALAEERSPQSSSDDVRELVADALRRLGDVVSDTRVQLMTDYANSFYLTDRAKAERLAGEALRVGRQAGSATLARALTGYAQAKLRPGNAAERLEIALEAQPHARRANLIESLVLALTYEASALIELGELRRAGPPLRYAEALAFDSRVPRFQWWVAAWSALVDFASGDLDGAEDRFRASFDLWPSSARNDAFECFAAQICALRLVQGRGAELLPVMAPMLEGNDLAYLAPTAFAQVQAGDIDGAAATLDRLMAPGGIAECGDIRLPYLLAMSAEAAHLVKARQWGQVLADLIEPIADVHVTLNVWGGGGFYWGSLRHAYGLALDLAGRSEEAVAAFVQTARDQTTAGVPVFAQRSQQMAEALA
jgi:tetratricopeptide (TPR) repeat protein